MFQERAADFRPMAGLPRELRVFDCTNPIRSVANCSFVVQAHRYFISETVRYLNIEKIGTMPILPSDFEQWADPIELVGHGICSAGNYFDYRFYAKGFNRANVRQDVFFLGDIEKLKKIPLCVETYCDALRKRGERQRI